MRIHDFVILALDAMGAKVRGKTLLQKRLYFLGLLTGHLEELGYYPHYYGPYSEQISDAVGRLSSTGFVDQEDVSCGIGNAGFELVRSDYALTADGKEIAQMLKEQSPKTAKAVADAWRRIDQASKGWDYMRLSVAAKLLHILRERGSSGSEEEMVEAARKFGWEVKNSDVKKAEEFLSSLAVLPGAKETVAA